MDELRDVKRADLVVVLSHNGITADLKLARRVSGIDVVLGGHTHDALPAPIVVGRTLVINSGSHGKFLSRLDLDVRGHRVAGYRYRLIPVLSRELPEDPEMARLIAGVRAPHEARLGEPLAVSESLLWRRGNFNGTFDELILDALLERADAEVAFSPGFRWGVSVVPGQVITLEDVYTHTALTYPNTWTREMTGLEIHTVMEDVADNLFHRDPYYRQGGDMVRVGGLTYAVDPSAARGARIRDVQIAGRPLRPGPTLQGDRMGEPRRGVGSTGVGRGRGSSTEPQASQARSAPARAGPRRMTFQALPRVRLSSRLTGMNRLLSAVLAGVLLTTVVASASGSRRIEDVMMDMQVTPLDPQAPPPLSVTTLEGARVSLADMRGQVVLVYFWATW